MQRFLNVDGVARELGIPGATLHGWVAKFKNSGSLDQLGLNASKSMSNLVEENRRSHKALAIAQEEMDILKKAAAYFAAHQKKSMHLFKKISLILVLKRYVICC